MSGPSPGVAAVIVTHHPDDTLAAVLDAALAQTERVVVVDNGSPAVALAAVEAAAARHADRVEVIRNPGNRGLAAAQNQGLARAVARGARWLLLLDQDSVPQPGMVAALLAALADGTGEPVGIAAAVPREHAQARPTRFVTSADGRRARAEAPEGPVLRHLLYAIASGSLIPATVLAAVGPMREDFFIDYVDFEFALRVRRAGYDIVAVRDAELRHRLGRYEERRLFGRLVAVTHHSARRRYTRCRNRVRLLRLHGHAMPALLCLEMRATVTDLVRVVLFEHGRLAKLAAMGRGIVAGLRG
ncbi:glycosyltransferase [Azospirillum sp. ST 5-10]|uniref:glycosyltransferase n=1 Tax=unclassified Azospirillum TaxID=2630922 RepID=UPI003F4A20EF